MEELRERDGDGDLADFLADELGEDAEEIRRQSDAVDLPPPWKGDVTIEDE